MCIFNLITYFEHPINGDRQISIYWPCRKKLEWVNLTTCFRLSHENENNQPSFGLIKKLFLCY